MKIRKATPIKRLIRIMFQLLTQYSIYWNKIGKIQYKTVYSLM